MSFCCFCHSSPLLKGGRCLKTVKTLFCSKRLWKDSALLKSRKKYSKLYFRCVLDPVRVTVKMGSPGELKNSCPQNDRKTKAYHPGEWSDQQDTDDKKAGSSWFRNQQGFRNSQCSSHLSDSETPQPACPVGSVASWVRFSLNPPERVNEPGNSSTRYGAHARNHQRATGDKQHSLEVAAEVTQGQRFLQHSLGSNTEEPGIHRSEHSHEPFNHQSNDTHFIPSPILPGPRRVVYSTLASDAASRTPLNHEHYAHPHSSRGHQNRLGLEWQPQLPAAHQAEVYVYLVSPPLPSPEHNPEQPNHPFSATQTISGKDVMANRISFRHSRGSSSQGPADQGCETHKQRRSIWERKHQKRSLQPNSDYEKMAGSSGGTNQGQHEPFPHNADRGRGGLDAALPTIAS